MERGMWKALVTSTVRRFGPSLRATPLAFSHVSVVSETMTIRSGAMPRSRQAANIQSTSYGESGHSRTPPTAHSRAPGRLFASMAAP